MFVDLEFIWWLVFLFVDFDIGFYCDCFLWFCLFYLVSLITLIVWCVHFTVGIDYY